MCGSVVTEQPTIRSIKLVTDRPRASILSQPHWQASAGLALAAITLLGLVVLLSHWRNDDPYITFRYAQNLLSGRGFVYNAGERVLSTTAPLYAFWLAGLGIFWPDLPALGNALSALCLVLAALCLHMLSAGEGRVAVGMLAALLLSLSPELIPTFGAETCAVVMLTLGALLAYSRSRHLLCAVLLAAVVMVRPDGLLVAISIGIYHVLTRQPVPWRAVALWAALVGIWYAGLWWYFGNPLPVTLLAKQHQGQMAITDSFFDGFLFTIRTRLGLPLYWLHAILAVVGLGQVAAKSRHWIPLLLWTALYFGAYTILGVSRYFWYYGPLAPAMVVLVAEGAVAVLRALVRLRLPRSIVFSASGLVVIALLLPFLAQVLAVSWFDDPRVEVYTEIGHWLNEQTEPEASVGVLEAGIIGYYAQRTIIDFAGLIQPDVAWQLGPSSTYEDSATWAIQRYWPDYVLFSDPTFNRVSVSDWFRANYRPVRAFTSQRDRMELYARSAD